MKLPEQISAVSPLGEALDGTGTNPIAYSVPPGNPNGKVPAQPQSSMWACHAKGCPRHYGRNEAEDITAHLRMHLIGIGPRAAVPFTATPELCAYWLATTTRRRKIVDSYWRPIQIDIENGDWLFDGNPFGLDAEGNLIQGGHRATAIAAARRDVESALIGDLDVLASMTMDTSKSQQFGDVLKALGYKRSGELAGATQLLWRYENDQLNPLRGWHDRVRPSNHMLMRLFKPREEEIKESVSASSPVRRVASYTSRAAMAVAWIVIHEADSGSAASFFRALALKGEHAPLHGERDPIGAWHRKWGRQSKREPMQPAEQLALTIKCWNAYAGGRPVRELVWRPGAGEAFPVPRLPLAARDDHELDPTGEDWRTVSEREVEEYVNDRPLGVSAGDVAAALNAGEASIKMHLGLLAKAGKIQRLQQNFYGPLAATA